MNIEATDATGTSADHRVSFTVQAAVVGYYRFDETGLYRVIDDVETRLVEGPIVFAADDRLGGVLYGLAERPVEWLRQGATEPAVIHYGGLVGVLDGRPVMVMIESGPDSCPFEEYYWGERFVALDLATGTRTPLFCDRDGPDGGTTQALGDRLIAQVGWEQWEPMTNHAMTFTDPTGNPIDVPTNPFPTSCAPCELDALLSPDGTLLAYRYRPDAYWPEEVAAAMTYEEWLVETADIPGEVVVIALDDGSELFRVQVTAHTRLVDFDGTRVAVWDEDTNESTIHDRSGDDPLLVDGQVVLMQTPLAAAKNGPFLFVTMPVRGQPVVERAYRFEGVTDPGATVTAGGRYPADVDEAGNWSIVLMLQPGSNLATFVAAGPDGTATQVDMPVVYRVPIELSGSGLGVVAFGDPADQAMATLKETLGSPSEDRVELGPFDGLPDGYMASDYFRVAEWADYGLQVIFSDGEYFTDSGAHLIAWRYSAPAGESFTTPEGMGIGTSIGDIREMYFDRFVAGELDVCVPTDFYVGVDVEHAMANLILGWLSGPVTDPDSEVVTLAGGVQPGC